MMSFGSIVTWFYLSADKVTPMCDIACVKSLTRLFSLIVLLMLIIQQALVEFGTKSAEWSLHKPKIHFAFLTKKKTIYQFLDWSVIYEFFQNMR